MALVGLEEEHRGNDEPEGLGGLEVDHQLECRGLLDGQVPRLGPFQDLVHIGGRAPVQGGNAGPIGHEAPSSHISLERIHDRQAALGRKLDDLSGGIIGDGVRQHDECVGMIPLGLGSMVPCAIPPPDFRECRPLEDHCRPRINHVSSGAEHVGREHRPESMIVGQEGCSVASRALCHCEPQQVRKSLLSPHSACSLAIHISLADLGSTNSRPSHLQVRWSPTLLPLQCAHLPIDVQGYTLARSHRTASDDRLQALRPHAPVANADHRRGLTPIPAVDIHLDSP
jgi:hypothetical protein